MEPVTYRNFSGRMEKIKWNKYGKKCFKQQEPYRMGDKYLSMLKQEELLPQYYHHQGKYTLVSVWIPVLH